MGFFRAYGDNLFMSGWSLDRKGLGVFSYLTFVKYKIQGLFGVEMKFAVATYQRNAFGYGL
jgi:hypothetical protein